MKSPYTFSHAYSDDVKDEVSLGTKPGGDHSKWKQESEWSSNPTRTHWFEVHHADKGKLGVIPVQTEHYTGEPHPTLLDWGYSASGQVDEKGLPTQIDKLHGPEYKNEHHARHADAFLNTLKDSGLDIVQEHSNIKDDLRAHLDNLYNTDSMYNKKLHHNTKKTPFEYITKKPGQHWQ